MTLFLALAISLAALAWALWPLFDKSPVPVLVDDDRLTDLLSRKEAIVAAIKDLEFDYRVGKLSQEDYERYDQRLRRQAIGLMQQIEQVAPASTELETSIEAEVARHRRVQDQRVVAASVAAQVAAVPPRATQAPMQAGSPAAASAAPVAASVVTAPGMAGGNGARPRFCTNCGYPLEPQHKFCANCGTPVGGSE